MTGKKILLFIVLFSMLLSFNIISAQIPPRPTVELVPINGNEANGYLWVTDPAANQFVVCGLAEQAVTAKVEYSTTPNFSPGSGEFLKEDLTMRSTGSFRVVCSDVAMSNLTTYYWRLELDTAGDEPMNFPTEPATYTFKTATDVGTAFPNPTPTVKFSDDHAPVGTNPQENMLVIFDTTNAWPMSGITNTLGSTTYPSGSNLRDDSNDLNYYQVQAGDQTSVYCYGLYHDGDHLGYWRNESWGPGFPHVEDGTSNDWSVDAWTHELILDVTDPTANAGPDQWVDEGSTVTFDGSGSTDNIGIADYTWTFEVEGSTVVLFEVNSTYLFTTQGTYLITLKVSDAAGNHDNDRVTINVNGTTAPVISNIIVGPSNPTNRDTHTISCEVVVLGALTSIGITYLKNGTAWTTVPLYMAGTSYQRTFGPVNKSFTYFLNATDSSGNTATYSSTIDVRTVIIEATLLGLKPGQKLTNGSAVSINGTVLIDGVPNPNGIYISVMQNDNQVDGTWLNPDGSYGLDFTIRSLEEGDNTLEIMLIDVIGGEVKTLGSYPLGEQESLPWLYIIGILLVVGGVAIGIISFRKDKPTVKESKESKETKKTKKTKGTEEKETGKDGYKRKSKVRK